MLTNNYTAYKYIEYARTLLPNPENVAQVDFCNFNWDLVDNIDDAFTTLQKTKNGDYMCSLRGIHKVVSLFHDWYVTPATALQNGQILYPFTKLQDLETWYDGYYAHKQAMQDFQHNIFSDFDALIKNNPDCEDVHQLIWDYCDDKLMQLGGRDGNPHHFAHRDTFKRMIYQYETK